jgi:cell shape-determining protein MreC
MKMTSHRRSSSERFLIAIVVTATCALIVLNTPLRKIGTALAPLDRGVQAVEYLFPRTASWFQDHYYGVPKLKNERDAALREREQAMTELRELRTSIPEYEELRTLKNAHRGNPVIASVLTVPNETPYDTLLVDRGSADSVSVGAVVYTEGTVPIGTVVLLREHTSIISLFTSPGVTSQVYAPREQVLAKAVGMGGGALSVFLPHGSTPQIGDAIRMPTLSQEAVGQISRVWNDPAEPGVIAAVTLPVALSSVRMVSIDRAVFTMPSREEILDALSKTSSSTAAMFTIPEDVLGSSTPTSTPAL